MEEGLLNAMCKQPYEEITVSSLCETMHIPRKAFYRYFGSKEDALYALIDHTIMDFVENISGERKERAYGSMEQFFVFWEKKKEFLMALDRGRLGGILLQRSVELAKKEKRFPVETFTRLPATLTRDYMVTFMVSGIMSLVLEWYRNSFEDTPQQMAAVAVHLLTEPLYPLNLERRKGRDE